MKIVCITPDDLSTLIFCKTLCEVISQKNTHEVLTIGGPVLNQAPDLYTEEIALKLKSRHLALPMKRFFSPFEDFKYCLRLYKLLKFEKPDCLITFTTKPNIWGQIAAIFAGVSVRIMAIRGLGRTFAKLDRISDFFISFIVRLLFKIASFRVSKVWFTNDDDLKVFLDLGIFNKNRIFITKNAIDLTDYSQSNLKRGSSQSLRLNLGIPLKSPVILMVARMVKEKGIIEYANASIEIFKSMPNVFFLLVAPLEGTEESDVLCTHINAAAKKSNLLWLGFRKDVRELYGLCDLAVLPSYYKEGGYPRALLEAMAYKKPIIAANTLECRGPVIEGFNGMLVPPKNFQALAFAIKEIISNPEKKKTMGENSLTRVRDEFDDRLVFNRLYDEVIFPLLNIKNK